MRCQTAAVQVSMQRGGSHLIILVCVVPSEQMLLYKQFLEDSVVNGWDWLLEVLVESLLGV